MKKVQRTFTVEYKSGRRKIGAQPSSIWGNMDLKSVARAVENEGTPFRSSNPFTEAAERSPSLPPDGQRDLTSPVQGTDTSAESQAMPAASEAEPITQVEAPALKSPAPSHEHGDPETVHDGAKRGVVAQAGMSTDRDHQLNKPRGRTSRIAGNDIGRRRPFKPAPKNLGEAKLESPSVIDAKTELIELEAENIRLRMLLAKKLRAENAILRDMLHLN